MNSNQAILTKAIEKAIAGGWVAFNTEQSPLEFGVETHSTWDGYKFYEYLTIISNHEVWGQQDIIFNHDFAKSIWGEGMIAYVDGRKLPAWMLHLKEMVVADDPIKYLGDNL